MKKIEVKVRYLFEGTYTVAADDRNEARTMVTRNCGLVLGGDIHTTTYLAPISSSGDLMLLEFTRKPTKFRLVMRPAPIATTHHFGIATPSKEYHTTLRPYFDGDGTQQRILRRNRQLRKTSHINSAERYSMSNIR